MEQILLQVALISCVIFLIYKLIIAIRNIFIGSKEIVQHSAEFTKIIARIGRNKFQQKMSDIKLKIEEEINYQERRKQTILLIALEFNVSLDVAEALLNEFEKNTTK